MAYFSVHFQSIFFSFILHRTCGENNKKWTTFCEYLIFGGRQGHNLGSKRVNWKNKL